MKSALLPFLRYTMLLVLSLSMPNFVCADIYDCKNTFIGWDVDSCLMPRTRTQFAIPTSSITDDQLNQYIEQHIDGIVKLHKSIEHGYEVAAFLNGSLYDAQAAMQAITDEAFSWVINTFITGTIETIFLDYADILSLDFLSNFYSAYSQANGAKGMLSNILKVMSVSNHRQLFQVYMQDRKGGMSTTATWQDLKDDFQPIIDYVCNTAQVSENTLRTQFEYDYQSYLWLTPSGSKAKLHQGKILVALATPRTPTISQNPLSGSSVTTFVQSGSGFVPNGYAILHFRKPDGSEYPTQITPIDPLGNFSLSYSPPPSKEPGNYAWWAIDGYSRRQSNQITYDVTPPPFGPSIAQSPNGGPDGTIFRQWGTGFTPNSQVTLHFLKSDGSEYPTQSVSTNGAGYFETYYTVPSGKEPGIYTWWAIDDHTEASSNQVSYEVTFEPQTVYVSSYTVYGSETWQSGNTYIVQGTISVGQESTLTIQSGATVKMSGYARIDVSGTLKATGVKFTWADEQNPWSGISFTGAGASGSRLENCEFEHANGYYTGAVIHLSAASPIITGCTLHNSSAAYGIFVRDSSSPQISNSTINGLYSMGIYVYGQSSPSVTDTTISGSQYGLMVNSDCGGTYTGNTFSGNQYGAYVYYSANSPHFSNNTYTNNSVADLYAYGTITGNVTWDGAEIGSYGIAYLDVAAGASLTIQSGATVKLSGSGSISVSGTLNATGVKFTWADGQSPWAGIRFTGAGASGSRLENCEFEHANGSYNSGAIIYLTAASPTITGCTLHNSSAPHGIYMEYASSPQVSNSAISGMSSSAIIVSSQSSPSVTGSTISGCQYGIMVGSDCGGTYTGNTFSGNQYGAYVYYSANNPHFSNNTYVNNSVADLYAYGTITGNVTWDGAEIGSYGIAYLDVAAGASLTIQSGATVKLSGSGSISVSGTLKATGVKFTWADGQSPWAGIRFTGAGASGSRLENCEFEHANGSYNSGAIIYLTAASPTITGCTLHNSSAPHGIYMEYASSPQVSNSAISGMSSSAIIVSSQSSPSVTGSTISGCQYGIMVGSDCGGTYTGNTFSGNSIFGLYCTRPISSPLTAKDNNWGDSTGPLDDSDDRATGGLYNPAGKGNKVSDNVNYYPWTGCTTTIPSTPTNLTGIPSMNSVNLKWTSSSEAGLTGYKIYYGTEPGLYGTPQIVGAIAKYKLAGLANDTPYYIAISAMNNVGAESDKSYEITETPLNKYPLVVSFVGDGQGTVVSTPDGIACDTEMYALFSPNTLVDLQGTAAEFSLFNGWSGDCASVDDCAVVMDNDKYVTAEFKEDKDHKALIFGTLNYYPTLMNAYTNAISGNFIQAWGTDFNEALVLSSPKAVTIKGGYNQGYTNNGGYTTLRGTLTIRAGSLAVENLVIK